MEFSFVIPYPKSAKGKAMWNREYGMNAIYAGKHWSKRKRDAEDWHTMTAHAMRRTGNVPHKPFGIPVCITFFWNDRLDLSNHAYMAKMIEDALKGVVIVDDSRKYVIEHLHKFWDGDGIQIIVQELSQLQWD